MPSVIGNLNGLPVTQYDDGSCWVDYGNGLAELVDCGSVQPKTSRPRIALLSTNNPFHVPAYNAGNVGTVTVSASESKISSTKGLGLLILAGGLLAVMLLKSE